MKPSTRLLRLRVATEDSRPSVTPLYQVSAFEAGSSYFYTRKDNPNVAELEQAVALLEDARIAVATTCGMSAIRMCLDLLEPGDALVVHRMMYGCSLKLFQQECQRLRCDLHVVDLGAPEVLCRLPSNLRLLMFETPTNPFLHNLPIRSIAEAAHAASPRAVVAVDNTWAGPLFQQPLKHGADISLHSGTKYLGGHSDVMLGMLLTDRQDLGDGLRSRRFYTGAILDPHSAWLSRRSLQTLELRMSRQSEVTRRIASFLTTIPQIVRVWYPHVDGTQLLDYAGIVFIDLRPDLIDRYHRLAERLELFGTGTGMACVTSMVAQPYTGSHASLDDAEKAEMGLGRGTVRLCIGLEDPEDLELDLTRGFASLELP